MREWVVVKSFVHNHMYEKIGKSRSWWLVIGKCWVYGKVLYRPGVQMKLSS